MTHSWWTLPGGSSALAVTARSAAATGRWGPCSMLQTSAAPTGSPRFSTPTSRQRSATAATGCHDSTCRSPSSRASSRGSARSGIHKRRSRGSRGFCSLRSLPLRQGREDRMMTRDDGGADVEVATRAVQTHETSVGIQALVLSGKSKGVSLRIGERLRIGKAPDNELVLLDDTVSRHHCELLRADGGVLVRDLGSTNGTRVQGAKVSEAVVQPGAVLQVGEVEIVLRATVRSVEVMPSDKTAFGGVIGQSLAMRSIFGVLERIAPTEATVLLEGETGTGKDVLARAIWQESTRAQGPFVVVDCGAVSYSLLESELFGHERGAFTGAVAARQGAFELADHGTVFLDEIGELPIDVQPKLLRVLETHELRRVGGNKSMKSDVRVLAATKRNLQREVHAGKFREDLYFRLAVVPITVPSLRARREDIPPLVHHILKACGGA